MSGWLHVRRVLAPQDETRPQCSLNGSALTLGEDSLPSVWICSIAVSSGNSHCYFEAEKLWPPALDPHYINFPSWRPPPLSDVLNSCQELGFLMVYLTVHLYAPVNNPNKLIDSPSCTWMELSLVHLDSLSGAKRCFSTSPQGVTQQSLCSSLMPMPLVQSSEPTAARGWGEDDFKGQR